MKKYDYDGGEDRLAIEYLPKPIGQVVITVEGRRLVAEIIAFSYEQALTANGGQRTIETRMTLCNYEWLSETEPVPPPPAPPAPKPAPAPAAEPSETTKLVAELVTAGVIRATEAAEIIKGASERSAAVPAAERDRYIAATMRRQTRPPAQPPPPSPSAAPDKPAAASDMQRFAELESDK